MALNIKNAEVEKLAEDVATITGESKTEAIRQALIERKVRLALTDKRKDRASLIDFLERKIWVKIPKRHLGRRVLRKEKDDILGYGPRGV